MMTVIAVVGWILYFGLFVVLQTTPSINVINHDNQFINLVFALLQAQEDLTN